MQHLILSLKLIGRVVAIAIGPLLLLVTLLLWRQSYRSIHEFAMETQVYQPIQEASVRGTYIGVTAGGMYVFHGYRDQSGSTFYDSGLPNSSLNEFRRDLPVAEFSYLDDRPDGTPPIQPNWGLMGFGYSAGITKSDRIQYWCFVVPLWFIAALLALPIVAIIYRWIARPTRASRRGFEVRSGRSDKSAGESVF